MSCPAEKMTVATFSTFALLLVAMGTASAANMQLQLDTNSLSAGKILRPARFTIAMVACHSRLAWKVSAANFLRTDC